MDKRNKNTNPQDQPILPGNEAGMLTGYSPQGIPIRDEDEVQQNADSQKRKPVRAKEKDKLKNEK